MLSWRYVDHIFLFLLLLLRLFKCAFLYLHFLSMLGGKEESVKVFSETTPTEHVHASTRT